MKRYVGFDAVDADALARLKPVLAPFLPGVVNAFYEAIIRHPRARAVFADDLGRIERLKGSLHRWLQELCH